MMLEVDILYYWIYFQYQFGEPIIEATVNHNIDLLEIRCTCIILYHINQNLKIESISESLGGPFFS